MELRRERIAAGCPRYACAVCRTKTGWPQQSWCPIADLTLVGCSDCCYRGSSPGGCRHPQSRKVGECG